MTLYTSGFLLGGGGGQGGAFAPPPLEISCPPLKIWDGNILGWDKL